MCVLFSQASLDPMVAQVSRVREDQPDRLESVDSLENRVNVELMVPLDNLVHLENVDLLDLVDDLDLMDNRLVYSASLRKLNWFKMFVK